MAPVTQPPEIGVGMLGYAFMGKAHSLAFLNVRGAAWPIRNMSMVTAVRSSSVAVR